MKRSLVFVLLCCLFAPFVGTSSAQDATTPPLIAYFNQQIYRLTDNTLVPYDACLPDEQITGNFIAAPDGTQFVMMTLPPVLGEAIAQLGSLGGGPIGANIWLCDTRTNALTRIFAVEGGDAIFEGEFPNLGSIISPPSWSPDSQRVVWSQQILPDTINIQIYDVEAATITTIDTDILPELGIPAPPAMIWQSNETLLYSTFALNDETFASEEYINLFDLTAETTINTTLLDAGGELDDFIVDRVPLTREDGSTTFALRYFEAGWQVANSVTGEQQPLDGLPERYSPTAPEGESLLLDIDLDFFSNWERPTGNLSLPAYPPSRVAIAPDGSAIAYADSVLQIWRSGFATEIMNSDGFADDLAAVLLWGGVAYRVGEAVAIVEVDIPACEGTLLSRLLPGDMAQVIEPTVPNNLRDEPSIGGVLIGQLAGGSTFTILEGPVCANNFAWYQVEQGDLIGWTAEALPETYLIAPATTP